MNRTFKAAVAALMLAVSFAGSAAAGPFDDALAAYKKGDYATALRLLRPVAEQGDVDAQFLLALVYELGRGVPQDYGAAVIWYRKAALQDHAKAQFSVGVMYYEGEGITQDYAAAASWWRKAAEQGNLEAQYSLGLMYARGRGVPQDYVTAHKWLNLAAVNGNKDAVKGRDIIAAQMTPAQIAEAQKLAREWKPTPAPH
jgi:uncharacterized protein